MDHHWPRSAEPGRVDRTARKGHSARLRAAFHSFRAARLRASVRNRCRLDPFWIRSKRLGPQPSTKCGPPRRAPLKQTKHSYRTTEKRLKRKRCMTIRTADAADSTGKTQISSALDQHLVLSRCRRVLLRNLRFKMHKPVTSYDFRDRLRANLIDQNHPAHEGARRLLQPHDRQEAGVNPTTRRLIGNSRHSYRRR